MFLSKTITAIIGLCSLFAPAAAWTNPIRNPGGSDPHMVSCPHDIFADPSNAIEPVFLATLSLPMQIRTS